MSLPRKPARRACLGFLAFCLAWPVALQFSGPALAQTTLRLALDAKIDGPAAPFFVAIDKGYFKAEGLDVAVDPGTGTLDPLNRIAAGSADIGYADINALMRYRDANPPVPIKAVFMVHNRPAYSIVGRRSRGIETPKDLEGRSLGAPATDRSFAQWTIFTQANGIDAAKVKIENIGAPVREPMLQSGQVDAITGQSFSTLIDLKSMNVPADDLVLLLMADHGVNLYGNAIVVSPKLAAEKPEAVRGFLRALVKGLKDTVKNPAAAVDAVRRHDDSLRKSVELERLRMAIADNILTPEVKANGYGAVDDDRFAKAIAQLAVAREFKKRASASEAFDASFLPDAAERRVK